MQKTNIEIVGLGKRMKGVSTKNGGKPYDFQNVSFLYDDRFVTGQKAATCIIQGVDIDAIGGIMIGQVYPAVIEEKNNYVSSVLFL